MSSDIKLSPSFEYLLNCPHCKGTYLHQYKYEIFERSEDAQVGTHAVISGDGINIDRSMAGNPSARRDGAKIYFTCEGCDESPTLLITQHKGQTFIQFE
ncbi:hypothetical protein ACM26Q_24055 [Kluyvera ascorbata]|uniref:hypothetical protein n=1 Tax=Kluyvera ascorbata TaxID=51288 RepID=UPI0039F6B024